MTATARSTQCSLTARCAAFAPAWAQAPAFLHRARHSYLRGALQAPIPTSILRLGAMHERMAIKMFWAQLDYMSTGVSPDAADEARAVALARRLLQHALQDADLRDELYLHLIKQTRGNPDLLARRRAWELFGLLASSAPPSERCLGIVQEYLDSECSADVARAEGDMSVPREEARDMARATRRSLERCIAVGPRRTSPSAVEVRAALDEEARHTVVLDLDGGSHNVEYTMLTTVRKAVVQLARSIGLCNHATFVLCALKPGNVAYIPLSDDDRIVDVLAKACSAASGSPARHLVIRRRVFLATGKDVDDEVFVRLSYAQARQEWCTGYCPVAANDAAAALCALQMQAEVGSALVGKHEAVTSRLAQCVARYAWHGLPTLCCHHCNSGSSPSPRSQVYPP